jgi:prevent-host-death family protein
MIHFNKGDIMQATAQDLRLRAKELLDSVGRGEEVFITRKGRLCAKLVPVADSSGRLGQDDELFGIWKDHALSEKVEDYVRTLRKGRFDAD